MDLSPEFVSLSAKREFEDVSSVVEVMKQIRSLNAVSDFDNQLFDLGGDDPIVLFTDETGEEGGQNNLVFAPGSNFPATPEDDDPSILRIQASFDSQFDLLQAAFGELLNPDDGILNDIDIVDMSFSFSTENDFQKVEELGPLFDATDHTVTGIQFKHEKFIYIFQQTDGGIAINVNGENTFNTEDNKFIGERLEQAKPFIQSVIQGDGTS